MRRSSPLLGSWLLLAGCAVTEVPLPEGAVAMNQCEGPEDCPGATCAEGACLATRSEIESVLVEVTPPPDGVLAPLPFQTTVDESNRDIVLQPAAKLTGYVSLDYCVPTFLSDLPGIQYAPVGGTIPVSAAFRSSAHALGLPAPIYRSTRLDQLLTEGGKHAFEVLLPPGDYDVYLEPLPTTGDSPCQIPPWLLLKQHITTSGKFEVNLSQASSVTVPVHWATASLDNWAVQMIDSVSGRLLSAPALLSNPGLDKDGRALYVTTLTYSPVLELNDMGRLVESPPSKGLVRLVPPEDTVAPTILGEVSAVGLMESYDGGLLLSSPLPPPVTLEGQTADLGTFDPVAATVTLTATRIEGMDQGLFGTFERTYEVDKSGIFRALVPPGEYRVDAIPRIDQRACASSGCPRLASRRETWQVGLAPELQAGKIIQFERAPIVTGDVFSPAGKPIAGAAVRATASSFSDPPNVWDAIDRSPAATPHATAGLIDHRGSFNLRADPGVFHFFVQPDSSTRFGWYVRPLLDVGAQEAALGPLTLPFARAWSGRVFAGTAVNRPTVANALIRAYVYVTPEGEYSAAAPENGALIQVAETRSNDNGEFELLIPASLDSPSPAAD